MPPQSSGVLHWRPEAKVDRYYGHTMLPDCDLGFELRYQIEPIGIGADSQSYLSRESKLDRLVLAIDSKQPLKA